jgi:hypothetical protein
MPFLNDEATALQRALDAIEAVGIGAEAGREFLRRQPVAKLRRALVVQLNQQRIELGLVLQRQEDLELDLLRGKRRALDCRAGRVGRWRERGGKRAKQAMPKGLRQFSHWGISSCVRARGEAWPAAFSAVLVGGRCGAS